MDLHLGVTTGAGRRNGLEQALRAAIRSGRLAGGARLPSTRALATQLDLARGTVCAAYEQLAAEGYLSARTGSGTVVAQPPPNAGTHVPSHAPEEPPPRYDLRPGSPDVNTFPVDEWLRATRRALAGAPAAAYGYGDPRGRIELRDALAEYLGRARGVVADPERIVIASGYIQALALLSEALSYRTQAEIAMENPGLSFHRDVVRHNGSRVVALPVDALGARTDLLSTPDFARVRAVILTPAHQYPTGVTLHPLRRQAVTQWAQKNAALIVEDDYDGEFRFDRQPIGSLQGMAPDHVAFVGTASKTLSPAVRLAWIVLPEHQLASVIEAKRHADLHTESLGQLTLAELITSHAYDRHIRACRRRYRQRRDLLVARMRPVRGQRFTMHGVAAGLQAMISLPDPGPTETEILAEAASRGLSLDDLESCWFTTGDHPKGVIVGYARPADHTYEAAVDTLVRILRVTT